MIELRGYQRTAIRNLRASFKAGKMAPLLVAPTGSGKTVMLSSCVEGLITKGGSANWYAHRRELITQAARTLEAFGLPVGYAGINVRAPVQVLSVQGVLASGEVPACKMAFYDEAHHFASIEWRKLREAHKDVPCIGATATPERGDGAALDQFDDLVVAAQVSDLIALWRGDPTQGLVPVDLIRPRGQLGKGKIAQTPVDAYLRFGNGRSNVVFAPHIKAADDFAEQFRKKGIEALVVSGKTAPEVRDRTLERFAAGDLRVVINVMVLTEGWDCPRVGVVTIARDIGSPGMLLQICGRGMRPFPGKEICTIVDLRGATWAHGSPDEDKVFSLEGIGILRKGIVAERRCAICKCPLEEDATICPECQRPVPVQVTPTATGEELDRWAFKKTETVQERAAQLASFYRRFPGKDAMFYKIRFKKLYGMWPDSAIVSLAHKHNRDRHA